MSSTSNLNIPRQIRRKKSRNNANLGLSMTKSTANIFNDSANTMSHNKTNLNNLASPMTQNGNNDQGVPQTEKKSINAGFSKFIVSQSTTDLS